LAVTPGEEALFATRGQGFNYFTLASPGAPVLALQNTTAQLGWKHVVPNGSGLAFVAMSPNSTADGPHHAHLYDIRDVPGEVAEFRTTFLTPGLAAAVGVYNGLGYVADSGAGLQVINYLPADVFGIPPTIELSPTSRSLQRRWRRTSSCASRPTSPTTRRCATSSSGAMACEC
jgi:hypothetical protein